MQFVQSKQELKMFSNRGSAVATPDNESTYDDTIDNSMSASGMGSGSMYRSKASTSLVIVRVCQDNVAY